MIHVIVAVFAVLGTLWALAVWIVGGFTIAVAGISIQSHDPLRPLALAVVAAIVYFSTRGPLNARRLTMPLAVLLALCPAAAGIARNSWTGGGADQYAYVSQADLWLDGDLTVPIPLAATAPWPEALLTFAPHGFRPAVSSPSLVPVTAPGLPLLMAAAKRIAGHCAMFLVTPLSGALLVWITFAIGRRLVSDAVGLAAAWLVATSPAVTRHARVADERRAGSRVLGRRCDFTLGSSSRSALMAGLAASAAILIRPNLAPLAAILVIWRFWTTMEGAAVVPTFRSVVIPMIAGTLPGCLFIAWINNRLYGSPLASGYGSLSALFSLSYIAINIERYGVWLVQSQTPLAVAGIAGAVAAAEVDLANARATSGRTAPRSMRSGGLGALPHLHAIRSLVVSQVSPSRLAGHVSRRGRRCLSHRADPRDFGTGGSVRNTRGCRHAQPLLRVHARSVSIGRGRPQVRQHRQDGRTGNRSGSP